MKYQAVLFDFDYTLGDSTGPITFGYQSGLTAMGWPAPETEQVRPTIGHTLQDGYTMLTGDTDPARRDEFYHRFQEAVGELAVRRGDTVMVQETRFFPHARELLWALKAAGVHTAIVSTKLGATIRAILEHNGMTQLVDLVVGGEDVTRAKPDPEGLVMALSRLELEPRQALFCGDTTIDARTALAGGADFCAVLNGTTPRSAFAPFPSVHISPDLAELERWLFAEQKGQ